jgi:hypothetical protein
LQEGSNKTRYRSLTKLGRSAVENGRQMGTRGQITTATSCGVESVQDSMVLAAIPYGPLTCHMVDRVETHPVTDRFKMA